MGSAPPAFEAPTPGLRHGIVNEIYYPTVDCPYTRDLQFLITDGETFCHEENATLTTESNARTRRSVLPTDSSNKD